MALRASMREWQQQNILLSSSSQLPAAAIASDHITLIQCQYAARGSGLADFAWPFLSCSKSWLLDSALSYSSDANRNLLG